MPSHLLQVRSVVALGTFVTRLPGAQVVHVVQTRGAVAEPESEAYCEPVHTVWSLHADWPAWSWNLLSPSHAVLLAPSHWKPGGHWMQLVELAR